jgi:hypothetical protein
VTNRNYNPKIKFNERYHSFQILFIPSPHINVPNTGIVVVCGCQTLCFDFISIADTTRRQLTENLQEKKPLETSRREWERNIKTDFQEDEHQCGLYSSGVRWGVMADL